MSTPLPWSALDCVEETIALGGEPLLVRRPRDSETLVDEHAFAHEEYLPYWAELWPSGLALARALAGRALRGARVVELGCGLGLVAVAAARAGGRVLATDWAPYAVEATAANAAANGVTVETALVDWSRPRELLERAPFELVLGADVLYEERHVESLLELLPRLTGERGQAWIAAPGRPPAEAFVERARERWRVSSTRFAGPPPVSLHKLTPR